MTHAFAFIFGFAVCLGLCRRRLRKSREAFNAARELLDVANEKIEKAERTLANIRGLAQRMKSSLGGRALLPAAAKSSGQHSGHMSIETAGPSFQRRSRFLGGGNNEQ